MSTDRDQLAAALEAGGATYLAVNPGRVLDALLPVVDRIANERAAAELRAAAEAWEKHGNSWRQMLAGNSAPFAYARWARARADALDPS